MGPALQRTLTPPGHEAAAAVLDALHKSKGTVGDDLNDQTLQPGAKSKVAVGDALTTGCCRLCRN